MDILNWYPVSNALNVGIILSVQLTSGKDIGDPGHTPVHCHNLVVSNVIAAVGDVRTLRYTGAHNIVNSAARDTARGAF
jgi:hypothetical protein